ncbi:MAG TPA: hypothetical protein VMZ69_02315 [Saprospiraceae bacterium]|nr:hypothetical protein [Saprospiraceae bacterium]
MYYTYFHRSPGFHWKTAHLFSPVKKKIPGMVCVSFPTMIADIKECDFLNFWSSSTRTKINKIENDELSIRRGVELLPDILKLFSETASLKKLRGHFPEDFDSRPWIFCSAIFQEEKILAGHVWVLDEEEKRALLFVNASAHHDSKLDSSLIGRAHYYLLWQDGMHLRNHGIDCLDLHGYQSDSKDPALQGVYKWKEGTHGQQEELYHYYPLWFYYLQKMRKNISE